jgi:hypothetical protein
MSTGTTAGEGHEQPFVPHVTINYAHGGTDSDRVQRLLHRVRPRHAPPPISAFGLEDLTPDSPEKTITWYIPVPSHRVPLPDAGPTSRSDAKGTCARET